MKLKKVVSLALAGVMAVSMLAGCGTNKKDEPTQDDNGAVKAGYSAEFADVVDLDLDYVTFKDSTVDQAALQAAVDSCSDVQLYAALVKGNISTNLLKGATIVESTELDCANVFATKADLSDGLYRDNATFSFGADYLVTKTRKEGVIIAVDGTMSTEGVMNQVNRLVKGLTTLQETNTQKDDSALYNYNYVVSVSLVSRTTTMSDAVKADIDFVAVTVTRTATSAELA